jgi:predicted ribonuclease YlaK
MTIMNLIKRGEYDRVVVMFNPTKTRGAADMGFYSGDSNRKAMSNSIGNILTTKFGDRSAVDYLLNDEKIKLVSIADCRGMEIRDREILYISEAQNTSIDLIKLCLTRVSENAKVIIEGDFDAQVDSRIFEGTNNGLKRVVQVFKGEPEFGYVELQKIFRSRIAQLCEKL